MRRALAPVLLACSLCFLLVACDKNAAPPGSGSSVTAGVSNNEPAPTPGSTPDPVSEPHTPATDPGPGNGPACGDKVCASGEECISYYGVAGPRGPKFQECGIPCKADGACPDGKKCQTIADGPGPVCR
jgi:hypothetical protein